MDRLDICNLIYLVFVNIPGKDIILSILSILTGLVILGFNIWKWCKAAKADNKITADEVEELKKQIIEDLENISDKIEK